MKGYYFHSDSIHKQQLARKRFFFWFNFGAAVVFALMLLGLAIMDWYILSTKSAGLFEP
jgi:hypothetical protein